MDSETVRVLYIEDEEDDYFLVRKLLSEIISPRYELEWAKTYEMAIAAIGSSHFDACLLDYRLGKHDGLELLQQINQNSYQAPVILLTAWQDRKTDMDAMQAGAADFLVKDEISPSVLERSIRYAMERKKMTDALRAAVVESKANELALRESERQLRALSSKLLTSQEEERKRVAGELHDSVGQTLAALKYGVEMVLNLRNKGDTERAFRHLEGFVPTLQRSIEETRAIYMGLRPTILEEMGVLATLQWLCRQSLILYPKHHIELDTSIKEEDVPEPLKIAIFRIAQEALNNVAKHSKAEWVDISLAKNADRIELTIQDDGDGIDFSLIHVPEARSLGLTGMREKAELTGGAFSIESAPGKGTTVRAVWPR
jgi:signal transduction histidine kinase